MYSNFSETYKKYIDRISKNPGFTGVAITPEMEGRTQTGMLDVSKYHEGKKVASVFVTPQIDSVEDALCELESNDDSTLISPRANVLLQKNTAVFDSGMKEEDAFAERYEKLFKG